MPNRIVLTEDSATRLRRELAELQQKLKQVLGQLGEAAETGGNVWHDNFAYEQFTLQSQMLSKQIKDLQDLLGQAEVVKPIPNKQAIRIGSTAKIEFSDGTARTVTIGDRVSSNPNGGIVSYESPLGRALLGARKGDKRTFTVGQVVREIAVVEIL
jgi:transcription elongation factor GreA